MYEGFTCKASELAIGDEVYIQVYGELGWYIVRHIDRLSLGGLRITVSGHYGNTYIVRALDDLMDARSFIKE